MQLKCWGDGHYTVGTDITSLRRSVLYNSTKDYFFLKIRYWHLKRASRHHLIPLSVHLTGEGRHCLLEACSEGGWPMGFMGLRQGVGSPGCEDYAITVISHMSQCHQSCMFIQGITSKNEPGHILNILIFFYLISIY